MNPFNHMFYAIAAITILSWNANAGEPQNLPNLGDQVPVGRMQAFVSPKGITWFLPLALRSELDCSPGSASSSAKRTCSLRIFNNYNQGEEQALGQIERNTTTKVVALSSLDAGKVLSVKESFPALPETLQTQEMLLQTLQMNGAGPYASVAIRGDGRSIYNLEVNYLTRGLGTFKSEVMIRGESVDTYLAINNAQALRQDLSRFSGRYTRAEVAKIIEGLMARLNVTAYNIEKDEEKSALKSEISRFFKYTRHNQYEVSQSSVQNLSDTHVILNERSAPFLAKCTVTLELRELGLQQTRCEEVIQ